VLAIGICLGLAGQAAATTLYGLTGYASGANERDNYLVRIDSETGAASSTKIVGGVLRSSWHGAGMTGSRGGKLTALVVNGDEDAIQLMDIDATTAAGSRVRVVDMPGFGPFAAAMPQGLAEAKKGRLFTVGAGALYRIDRNNGRTRLLAPLTADGAPVDISDLTFGGGKLYGTDGIDVYQINRRNGVATGLGRDFVGVGIADRQPTSLAIHGGVFYSQNSAAVLMRDFGLVAPTIQASHLTVLRNSAALMAERGAPAPVPVPAAGALLLAGMGALGLAGWRRRGAA